MGLLGESLFDLAGGIPCCPLCDEPLIWEDYSPDYHALECAVCDLYTNDYDTRHEAITAAKKDLFCGSEECVARLEWKRSQQGNP